MDPYGWDVKANQELLAFLRPYEAWRAEGIIRCGLVTVQHTNGAKEKTRDPRFKLLKGEKVFIPIGVPDGQKTRDVLLLPGCRKEMEDDATKRARDFVFQAHPSAYEDSMTKVLKRAHPNLIKIDDADDLATFLMKLMVKYNDAPIGTIHIVAHGSTRGNVNASLRPQRPGKDEHPITYERLEEAVKEITTVKAYPPLFLPPRPIDSGTKKPMPAAVRIRACRVGVHTTFLKKLKEALGPGIDVVSAPRFLQSAGNVGSSGDLEFLRHEFTLLTPKKLARPALIKAFQAGDLAFAPGPPTFFDGTAVPARAWDGWLPKQLRLTGGDDWDTTEKMRIIIPVPNGPIKDTVRVLFQWDEYTLPSFELVMAKEKPGSTDDALAQFAAHITAIGPSQVWSDRHPFPMSVRLGYKNLGELVKGFEWKVEEVDKKKYIFSFKGTRQEYSAFVPLTRGQDLVCNFYPRDPALQPLQMYREDDPQFFAAVV